MPYSTLEQVPPSAQAIAAHKNNFDFLRLLFATFVIITHSYALLGLPEIDVLTQVTKLISFSGGIAVPGFLVISGLLITKSMMRSHSVLDYFYKRALRILPGLWVVLGVMALIGFFVSGKGATAYFSHYSVRDYLFYGGLQVRSDNEEFPPYTIQKGEWQQLWCVVASLNFQMPAPRRNPTKQLYSFELEEMRNRLEILWKNYTGQ